MGTRGEPRFTRDVDVAVKVADDEEAEALIADLRHLGYRILAVLEHKGLGRLSTVRLSPPGARGAVVDLLFASSGIEPEIAVESELVELKPGLKVPVALRAHLIATKILARDDANRPQDLIDLNGLLSNCSPEELEMTRSSLELITSRGFHRGKELVRDLEELLARPG